MLPVCEHYQQQIPSSCTRCSRVLIPAKYEVVKQKVVGALIDVDLCSFMSNLWTDCHNRVYISLTVQFAASSMEMKNFCLMTKEVPEAHTAENLIEVLQQAIEEWELDSKVYGFTTDNKMNIVNAVVNHLRVIHLPCIGHTIQLAVEKAFCLQDIESALRKVLKLVG